MVPITSRKLTAPVRMAVPLVADTETRRGVKNYKSQGPPVGMADEAAGQLWLEQNGGAVLENETFCDKGVDPSG